MKAFITDSADLSGSRRIRQLSGLSLQQSKQDVVLARLLTNDKIFLPVAELLSGFDLLRALLDASAKNALVLFNPVNLRISAEFLG